MVHFPAPLTSGSRIAVSAFSSGVRPALHPRLDLILEGLRARGWEVVEGATLRGDHKGASAPAEVRAAELMHFLLDPTIAAVIPPWGGELAIEVLPLLDWEKLATVKPKWISGFSDVSTLQLPFMVRLDWATLHGSNLMDLSPAEQHPLVAATFTALSALPGSSFSQRSAERFQVVRSNWEQEPGAVLQATEPVIWKRLDGASAPHSLSGRLIGGCLDCISCLAGSPFGDVPRLITRWRDTGTIIYLENCELPPFSVARALWSLRLAGWFDGVAGVLIGRSSGPSGPKGYEYGDAVRSALGGLACPVLYDLDIGHRPPNLALVNGALAQLSCANGGGEVITTLR